MITVSIGDETYNIYDDEDGIRYEQTVYGDVCQGSYDGYDCTENDHMFLEDDVDQEVVHLEVDGNSYYIKEQDNWLSLEISEAIHNLSYPIEIAV